MNESELIAEIIKEAAPQQCKRISVTDLRDIVETRGQINLIDVEGDSQIDLQSALTIVASLASIISAGIIIYKTSLEIQKMRLQSKELEDKLFSADSDKLKDESKEIEPLLREKICLIICTKMESNFPDQEKTQQVTENREKASQ